MEVKVKGLGDLTPVHLKPKASAWWITPSGAWKTLQEARCRFAFAFPANFQKIPNQQHLIAE